MVKNTFLLIDEITVTYSIMKQDYKFYLQKPHVQLSYCTKAINNLSVYRTLLYLN